MNRTLYWAAAAACALSLSTPSLGARTGKPAETAKINAATGELGAKLFRAPSPRGGAPATFTPDSNSCLANVVGSQTLFCGADGQTYAQQNLTYAYPGIQYANAPRWVTPTVETTLVRAGSNTQPAFGSVCPQANSTQPIADECQYLNIWVPKSNINSATHAPIARLPVMVFIHGGAFVTGAGSDPLFDGTALAGQGVVLVTINYRLGVLGFMTATMPNGTTIPTNLGLLDQQAALQWVQNNVGAFGGDPAKVTIFGESAGAMSVGLHLFDVPSSAGLFQRAIMESNPMAVNYFSPATAQTIGTGYYNYLCKTYPDPVDGGCTQAWFEKLSDTQLIEAENGFLGSTYADVAGTIITWEEELVLNHWVGLRGLPWEPVNDNSLLCGQPYTGYYDGRSNCPAPADTPVTAAHGNAGQQQSAMSAKPLVFGINQDEGVLFPALYAFCEAYPQKCGSTATPAPSPASVPGSETYEYLVDRGLWPPMPEYNSSLEQPYQVLAALNGRYNYNSLPAPAYYSNYGQGLADIITDFVFGCANENAAEAAVQYTSSVPVWAYFFDQVPPYDPYAGADDAACATNVCHGSELAYVFGTLTLKGVPSGFAADLALSANMTKAWAAFAGATPQSFTAPWTQPTQYGSSGGQALYLTAAGPFPSYQATGVDPNGVCATVWNQWPFFGPLLQRSKSAPARR